MRPRSGFCEVHIRGLYVLTLLNVLSAPAFIAHANCSKSETRPSNFEERDCRGAHIPSHRSFTSTNARVADSWNDSNRGKASPECLPRCFTSRLSQWLGFHPSVTPLTFPSLLSVAVVSSALSLPSSVQLSDARRALSHGPRRK